MANLARPGLDGCVVGLVQVCAVDVAGAHRAYLSLSLASSLGSWGAGRAVKQGMRQGEVIETAVFNTYAMVMVWRVDPQEETLMALGCWNRIWVGGC